MDSTEITPLLLEKRLLALSQAYRSRIGSVEDPNNYREGGLHPVKLTDTFTSPANQTYKIIHKLGHGSYATVWLASLLDPQGRPL